MGRRRLAAITDAVVAAAGVLALRAMGATWPEIVVVACVAGGVALLVIRRASSRRRTRRRHS